MSGWSKRDTRYSIDWPLVIQQDGWPDVESRIFNVSMGGCSILSQKPYEVGSKLRLFLTVPNIIAERILLPNPIPIHCRVRWCREHLDINQVGVEFLFLSPIIRRAFVDAFEEFSRDILEAKGMDREKDL